MGEIGNVPSLSDMRWKFGVTASNDDLKVVGSCFIQIKLVLDNGPLYLAMKHIERKWLKQFLHESESIRIGVA
eukprot:Gb_06681 [translate_table: standard]